MDMLTLKVYIFKFLLSFSSHVFVDLQPTANTPLVSQRPNRLVGAILTWRALFTMELVIHVTGDLSRSRLVLCCASHTACPSGLCWGTHNPWLRDEPGQLIVTASAGSSHLVPVIPPPTRPCLYLKKQNFSRKHPFCLTAEMMNRAVFL